MPTKMNVLFHGRPYCTSLNPLPLYKGRHDVRTLGIEGDFDYRYDPVRDSFDTIYERIAATRRRDTIARRNQTRRFPWMMMWCYPDAADWNWLRLLRFRAVRNRIAGGPGDNDRHVLRQARLKTACKAASRLREEHR